MVIGKRKGHCISVSVESVIGGLEVTSLSLPRNDDGCGRFSHVTSRQDGRGWLEVFLPYYIKLSKE